MEYKTIAEWERKDFKLYEATMIALLVAAFLWELFIFVITVKFLRVFKAKKKVFALFLIAINLSLIWRLIWIWAEIYQNRAYTWEDTGICTDSILTYMNIMFLGIGAFLNVYFELLITFYF